MTLFRRFKIGLAPRLAFWIASILIATIFVDWAAGHFVPVPDVVFMEQRWLAQKVAKAQAAMEATVPANRPDVLRSLETDSLLEFRLMPSPVIRENNKSPLGVQNFEDLLKEYLTAGAVVKVSATDFTFDFQRSLNAIAVLMRQMPARMIRGKETGDEAVIVTPGLDINIQLSDGSWLNATQKEGEDTPLLFARFVAAPIFFVLVILAASYRASRILLRPIQQLAAAAERLGRERTTTAIPEMKIPEYKAIAESFDSMQTRLKRFVDERTQMLAAISHDLNTPLTRMRLLAEEIDHPLQRRQLLSDVTAMQEMIQTTLAFARDEAQQESAVSVDIASLILSICDTMTDSGQVVDFDGPNHLLFVCRPVAMWRALTNLIDNGCKYGGDVKVEVTSFTSFIEIRIGDHGPGIDPAEFEAAFKPFHRLEASRNRETGGTGLGLTIARDVIARHNGEIVLSRNNPQGLLVTIRLPRDANAAR